MSSRSEEIDAPSACHCNSEAASQCVSPPTSHEGGFAKADVQKIVLEELGSSERGQCKGRARD